VRVRILGKSEAPEFECRAAVFATGNNLVLVGRHGAARCRVHA
jgi:putative DNA primase/helicase